MSIFARPTGTSALPLAVVIGACLAIGATTTGCAVTTPDANYCANQDGDAFCRYRHPDEGLGFCLSHTSLCEQEYPPPSSVATPFDGCLATKPDESCYSPCGGRMAVDDDSSCLPATSSSGGTFSGTGSTTGGGSASSGGSGNGGSAGTTTGRASGETRGDSTTAGSSGTSSKDPRCGNGAIDANEFCDADLTCANLGLAGGMAVCIDCMQFDLSDCTTCGNLVSNPGEECDGPLPMDFTCSDIPDLSLDSGIPQCSDNCTYDTTNCYECGNGIVEGPELCDPGLPADLSSCLLGSSCSVGCLSCCFSEGMGCQQGAECCSDSCMDNLCM